MSTCGAAPIGGRRRKSRKMRGGMGYGMSGTIGTAGALYTPSWGGEITKAGAPVYDQADPQRGSSRRRRSRKMRGGDQVEVLLVKKEEVDEAPSKAKAIEGFRAAGAVDVMDRQAATDKGYYIIGPAPSTAGRRRKSKKASRKGRRKTMKGGAQWQSVAAVGHGFTGSGSRGLADPTAYASKVPPAGGPTQNPDGAYHV